MIELQGASRWYGQVVGLNDVSCVIPAGLHALLGPNGAGKTTMLKLVTGQLRPTRGTVKVLGEAPFANPRVLGRLGYCPESEHSYDEMTGREFVTMLAAMSGMKPPTLHKRVSEAIELVGMSVPADRQIGGYSKGMRQRIKLAQGIVHDPDVLILDEPLNGLDPVGRHHVTNLLRQFAEQGKCVVISSHILHEVEQLTRSILLIHRNRLVEKGDIYQIRGRIDDHPHRISIRTETGRALAKWLLDRPYVLSVRLKSRDGTLLEVETDEPDQFYAQFPEVVLEGDFVVHSFDSPDNNLEAVFRYLVGE
jgi:ABC-2 type transport system ATP-binding protein